MTRSRVGVRVRVLGVGVGVKGATQPYPNRWPASVKTGCRRYRPRVWWLRAHARPWRARRYGLPLRPTRWRCGYGLPLPAARTVAMRHLLLSRRRLRLHLRLRPASVPPPCLAQSRHPPGRRRLHRRAERAQRCSCAGVAEGSCVHSVSSRSRSTSVRSKGCLHAVTSNAEGYCMKKCRG